MVRTALTARSIRYDGTVWRWPTGDVIDLATMLDVVHDLYLRLLVDGLFAESKRTAGMNPRLPPPPVIDAIDDALSAPLWRDPRTWGTPIEMIDPAFLEAAKAYWPKADEATLPDHDGGG